MPRSERSRTLPAFIAMALMVCLAACSGASVVPASRGETGAPATTSAQLVVALVPDERARLSVLRAADTLGYTLLETQALGGLGLTMLYFGLPSGVTGQQAIEALEAAEPASTVGVNHVYELQQGAQAASRFDYASGLLAWPAGGCLARAPVGVIDTAVDPSSPGLRSARVISRRFAQGPAQATRHGTEVASVLADPGRLSGTTILNADVINSAGNGSDAATMILALDWLTDEGVRVVNMSLAGPYNKLLDRAVGVAAQRGMMIVAAAGNSGPRSSPRFPAGFDEVIAVTAIDADRRLYSGAVRGDHIDVAAPGVDVFVNAVGEGRFVTGTSIAAPFVSAMILADPALLASPDTAALRDRLATRTEDLGRPGSDRQFGAGLVQARDICTPGTG